jgi:hypothetical protein
MASAQKLTSAVRLAARNSPGATATIASPATANSDETTLRIGVPSRFSASFTIKRAAVVAKIKICRGAMPVSAEQIT